MDSMSCSPCVSEPVPPVVVKDGGSGRGGGGEREREREREREGEMIFTVDRYSKS